MGHLIMYLRHVLKDSSHRVILFSQWDYLFLRMIGNTLSEEGVANVFCHGNVMMRNKAIRQFQVQWQKQTFCMIVRPEQFSLSLPL